MSFISIESRRELSGCSARRGGACASALPRPAPRPARRPQRTVSMIRIYGSSGSTCSSQLITADGLLLHGTHTRNTFSARAGSRQVKPHADDLQQGPETDEAGSVLTAYTWPLWEFRVQGLGFSALAAVHVVVVRILRE